VTENSDVQPFTIVAAGRRSTTWSAARWNRTFQYTGR